MRVEQLVQLFTPHGYFFSKLISNTKSHIQHNIKVIGTNPYFLNKLLNECAVLLSIMLYLLVLPQKVFKILIFNRLHQLHCTQPLFKFSFLSFKIFCSLHQILCDNPFFYSRSYIGEVIKYF